MGGKPPKPPTTRFLRERPFSLPNPLASLVDWIKFLSYAYLLQLQTNAITKEVEVCYCQELTRFTHTSHVQSSNFSLHESRYHSGTDDATKHIFWRWPMAVLIPAAAAGRAAASNHDFAFPRCNTLETNRSTFISPLSRSLLHPSFSSFDPENKSAVMSNEAAKNAIILSLSIDANVGLI